MALINRVTQLFRADFHAVLDRIEEPEQVLRQAIRDMEEQLAHAARTLKLKEREQEVAASRRSEFTAKLKELDGELDLCFANDKPELARTLVRRKLTTERLSKRLDSKMADDEKRLAAAKEKLQADQLTLAGLKQKAELFAEQPGDSDSSAFDEGSWATREMTISDDEVDVAFLKERQARAGS